MSDLYTFLLILLGLWIWEGWVRLPPDAWVFRRRRRCWHAESTESALRIGSWAWIWLPPAFLKPRLIIAQGLAVSVSNDSIWLHASQAPNPGRPSQAEGRVLSWPEIYQLKADKHHFVFDNKIQGEAQGFGCPATLLCELKSLADTPPEDRSKALDDWAAHHLNPNIARRRLKRLHLLTRDLRLGLLVYGVWLFVMIPMMVSSRGWSGAWPWLLCGTLAYQGVLTCMARRAHARVLPHFSEERIAWILACSLSPASLLRSADQIAFNATADIHPAALGVALMEGQPKLDLFLRLGRDLCFPCQPLAEKATTQIFKVDKEHRMRLLGLLEKGAPNLQTGIHTAPPPLASEGGVAWCPRCQVVYLRALGNCVDCGIPLTTS